MKKWFLLSLFVVIGVAECRLPLRQGDRRYLYGVSIAQEEARREEMLRGNGEVDNGRREVEGELAERINNLVRRTEARRQRERIRQQQRQRDLLIRLIQERGIGLRNPFSRQQMGGDGIFSRENMGQVDSRNPFQ